MDRIAKGGYPVIARGVIIAGAICVGAFFSHAWWQYLIYGWAAVLIGLLVMFFRDPDRTLPDGDDIIVAPADGEVVSLKEVEEPVYIKGKATQISIFLSIFDVHINRLPASGKIEYVKYNPGAFLMARHDEASTINERADFGLRHGSGIKIFFRQITGFLARRIVYDLKEGDLVKAGRRFGMMKFGSRMDVLVPSEVDICVKEGDRTVAGETILGRLHDDN